MAKQPARLADFEIPRGEGTPSIEGGELATGAAGDPPAPQPPPLVAEAVVVPMRVAPRPVAEARQPMTIRLPVSMHERVRTLMFTSRRSQQDIVEDALRAFLAANEV